MTRKVQALVKKGLSIRVIAKKLNIKDIKSVWRWSHYDLKKVIPNSKKKSS